MHLKEITSQGYYIYEAPVRLWHWITALSIVVLAVTGYFIGRPLPSIQGEATFMFWMGWIRLIHFTTAYIFTVALLFRIYWACVGNEYAREMFLVPFWRRAWRKGVISEIRWYFFLEKEAHRYYGHNPVAGLAVMFYFWMSVLMVCSGFALYGEGLGTDSWAYQWFGWMIRLTGNDSLALHFWHRLGMWFIIAFAIERKAATHHQYGHPEIEHYRQSRYRIMSIVTMGLFFEEKIPADFADNAFTPGAAPERNQKHLPGVLIAETCPVNTKQQRDSKNIRRGKMDQSYPAHPKHKGRFTLNRWQGAANEISCNSQDDNG